MGTIPTTPYNKRYAVEPEPRPVYSHEVFNFIGCAIVLAGLVALIAEALK